MLTCSLAADEILCSEKDNVTQICENHLQTKDYSTLWEQVCVTVYLCVCEGKYWWTSFHILPACSQKPIRDRQAHYLHEVKAAWSLKEHLQGAPEFLCFPTPLLKQQSLLGVFPLAHGEGAPEHLHRFGLVRLQQRMHPLILSPHSLLQLRHCGLWRRVMCHLATFIFRSYPKRFCT